VKDVSALGVERNLFRYRPIAEVAIRATADATWQSVLRVAIAGIRAGSAITLSAALGLPAAVRRALSDQGVAVYVETDVQWIDRLAGTATSPEDEFVAAAAAEGSSSRPPRVRLVGAAESVAALHRTLAEAVGGDPDLAVYDNEVTTAGRLELLPFLHEQSITITAHRFGNPDRWSEEVI
jgi:RHH-type proline utilization regulon transcriptional repressor/proline dehydrogenase/delta 1-pyrroline-5-carboxylate dehydrogenase